MPPHLRRSIAIAVLAIVAFAAIYLGTRARRDFWDFEVYRTAAVRALAAEPLYRPEDGHYQFKYWPAFALAMSPFALLPAEAAKATWFAVSIALLVWFFRQTIAAVPDRRHGHKWLTWWLLLLTAKFIVKEIVNGQTNTLLAVLVLAAVSAGERNRLRHAGALLALSVFVKPYALLLLAWGVATFGAATLMPAAIVLTSGLLLPAVVYGWSGNLTLLQQWYAVVVETTPANLLFPENISLAAMWAKWLGPSPVASGLAIAAGVLCLAALSAGWTRRGGLARPAYLEAGLLLLLIPLLSPQGWDYVLLMALPLHALVVDRFGSLPRAWRGLAAIGFLLTSFTVFDLIGRGLYTVLMSWSVVSVGALLLFASGLHLRWRRAA